MQKGYAYYDRVKFALSQPVLSKCSIKIHWIPPSDDERVLSKELVAKYFAFHYGYEVDFIDVTIDVNKCYNIKVPTMPNITEGLELDAITPAELIEFIGMLSLDCTTMNKDEFISSYNLSCQLANETKVLCATWTSVFSTETTMQLFDLLK